MVLSDIQVIPVRQHHLGYTILLIQHTTHKHPKIRKHSTCSMQDDKHHDNARTNSNVGPQNNEFLITIAMEFHQPMVSPFGWRSDNGAHPCENDAAQAIVVLGGEVQSEWSTNSIIVWDPSTMEWKNGPNLNDRR